MQPKRPPPPCTLLGPRLAAPRLCSLTYLAWLARTFANLAARCRTGAAAPGETGSRDLNCACARGRHGARQHACCWFCALLEKGGAKVERCSSRGTPDKEKCLKGLIAARKSATLTNAWAVINHVKAHFARYLAPSVFAGKSRKLNGRIARDSRQAIWAKCLTLKAIEQSHAQVLIKEAFHRMLWKRSCRKGT